VDGVRVELIEDNLVIRFSSRVKCLSYAPYNGGLRETSCLLNHQVPKSFRKKPETELQSAIEELALPSDTVGFLTAASVKNYSQKSVRVNGKEVLTLCTVGLSNARGVGESSENSSTINTFVVVEQTLNEEALVNALATAVEAKALAMFLLDVRSVTSSKPAVGTSTDALAVVTLGRGKALRYAGSATKVGSAIGKSVFECVKSGVAREASVVTRLCERGVTLDALFEAAKEGVVGKRPKGLKKRFMRELKNALSDPNVCALICAAMRLDDEASEGLVPNLKKSEYFKDSPKMLADEQIGEAIASYIAGTKGVNNFRYYDMLKPRVLRTLPMFLDDALCALVGATMVRVYES